MCDCGVNARWDRGTWEEFAPFLQPVIIQNTVDW